QVDDAREPLREVAELDVLALLLEVRLLEARRVRPGAGVRAVEEALPVTFDELLAHAEGLLLRLAALDLERVTPRGVAGLQRDLDEHVALLTGVKAPQVLDPAALLDRPRQAAARRPDVPQDPDRVEQVG